MAARKRVGLLFSLSEGWIGGGYYFLNILLALKTLPDYLQPHIVIYSSDTSGYDAALQTGYAYLSYKNSDFSYSFTERAINKLSRIFTGKNFIVKGLPDTELPLLFGYYEQLDLHRCCRKLYWIPDFQEDYYPEFIGVHATKSRKKLQQELVRKKAAFVFSSHAAKADFERMYPKSQCTATVVSFAVTHPDFGVANMHILRKKYDIPGEYFMVCNQFWPHKNHITVLRAINILKVKKRNVTIVFSGKYNEEEEHVRELFNYIAIHGIQDSVRFVGFINRTDQLMLMQNARSIIQPSLFEGWSTVVEDAKCLGKPLILSDLAVHREQATVDTLFFNALDAIQLAGLLEKEVKYLPAFGKEAYKNNVTAFAQSFLTAITNEE